MAISFGVARSGVISRLGNSGLLQPVHGTIRTLASQVQSFNDLSLFPIFQLGWALEATDAKLKQPGLCIHVES